MCVYILSIASVADTQKSVKYYRAQYVSLNLLQFAPVIYEVPALASPPHIT